MWLLGVTAAWEPPLLFKLVGLRTNSVCFKKSAYADFPTPDQLLVTKACSLRYAQLTDAIVFCYDLDVFCTQQTSSGCLYHSGESAFQVSLLYYSIGFDCHLRKLFCIHEIITQLNRTGPAKT
jgi:hypothetical protein